MNVRDETTPEGRWAFDESVTDAFADMLARSIPQHDVMRRAVTDVGATFVAAFPRTCVVDLGCARGDALAPFVDRFGAQNRYVGVEVSEPMLAAARARFPSESARAFDNAPLVDVRALDLRTSYPPETASLVLSVLTLQFTPIEYRSRILSAVFEHLVPGGAFVLVEKLIAETGAVDELMTRLYHVAKREAGYSDEQIVRKAAALEGVLVPISARMNEDLLRAAGFRNVECFWRWMNFAGWVAVR